jgi:LAO/AO transport system kinase
MLNLAHPVKRVFQHHGRQEVISQTNQGEANDEVLWIPPIQRTIATEGSGIEELNSLIEQHRAYLERTGELERRDRERLEIELRNILREALVKRWQNEIQANVYQQVLDKVIARSLSPWQAVQSLLSGGDQ